MSDDMMEILRTRFPAAFEEMRPLSRKIDRAIAKRAPDLSHEAVRAALAAYVVQPDYLRGLTVGAPRFDLDGQRRNWVSFLEAAGAAVRLDSPDPSAKPERSKQNALAKQLKAERFPKSTEATQML